jgi:flagellar motor switch protein FliM
MEEELENIDEKLKKVKNGKLSQKEVDELAQEPDEEYPSFETEIEDKEDKLAKYQKLGLSKKQAKEALKYCEGIWVR